VVVQGQEEVLVEGEVVEVGWGGHALVLDLVGIVSVPAAGLNFPIKREFLAMT
jgi:hypothetical protein